jgi:NAD+ kinase
VEALLVTPAAPHSAYNRGFVLSVTETVELEMLPTSGRLAIEVDGLVEGYTEPGDQVTLAARPQAARVVRLGKTTFYQRARRKLRLTDSAEIPASFGADGEGHDDAALADGDMFQLANPLTHRDGRGPSELDQPGP